MSYLENQIKNFTKSVNSSSAKIANKRTNAAPTTASPSPAPVPKHGSSKNDLKRKAEQANIVYSQPRDTGMGQYIMTQVTYAIEYLKTKGTPQTLTDLINYLSLQNRSAEYQRTIGTILKKHEKVIHEPENDGVEGLFSFRPMHNIRSADRLLGYLQSQPTAQGLSVRELRDGWPGAEEAINDLEDQGKLLVTRNKKDNHPKMVWPNDPSLTFDMDEEFQSIWHKIKLPEPGAVIAELEQNGLTPANKSQTVKMKPKIQEKKTKKPRKGGKTTNVHMMGVLRDYSHLKK